MSPLISYDPESSWIATIPEDVPALTDPEQVRELVIDVDLDDDHPYENITGRRTQTRLTLTWKEGEDGDTVRAELEPLNPDDDTDLDYWEWAGDVSTRYLSYGMGIDGESAGVVSETARISGLLFDCEGSCTFSGAIYWRDGIERVVIELQE